jgi:acyl-CoA synthetase (AMP-forming)/AMP-acid ligase II
VISGGVNIYPAEIEAVLAMMPGVRDCAVFGFPDEEFRRIARRGGASRTGVYPRPSLGTGFSR